MLYWIAVLTTIGILMVSWGMLTGPDRSPGELLEEIWNEYRLPLVAAVLVLPLMIGDVVRVSNRFVGPIYRLRRGLHSLAAGEPLKMMQFREGDFWKDLADEFNAVAARIERLERRLERANDEESAKPTEETLAASAALTTWTIVSFPYVAVDRCPPRRSRSGPAEYLVTRSGR
ncbi:MAG: hypothetical protein QM811_10025 [Pirellulales bacterium]